MSGAGRSAPPQTPPDNMRPTPLALLPYIILLTATLSACTADAHDQSDTVGQLPSSMNAARADSAARARQDSINRRQPGYIIDSILPLEEEMRRFRAAVGGTPTLELRDGAGTREALIARFAAALSAKDTLALRRLAITPREFIDVVYPSSPYTKAPYRQSPSLTWQQIQLPSQSGLQRLLDRHGGHPLRIAALRCATPPERQGDNLLHANCTVEFSVGSGPVRTGRLFGTILEHSGQFKLLSFSNMY